jgi:hypothetical protein
MVHIVDDLIEECLSKFLYRPTLVVHRFPVFTVGDLGSLVSGSRLDEIIYPTTSLYP